jgi:hypothetical protein
MGCLLGLGEVREKGWGLLTMLWVTSTYSSLPWYSLRKEIELRDAMCSRLKMTTWGPPPTSGKVDGAVVEVFDKLHQGRGVLLFLSSSSSSFSPLLLFSPFPFSFLSGG